MYKCNDGYVLRGTSERTCQSSGRWSGSLPRCELVDCGDPGTPSNGFKTGSNYKFGSVVSYSCTTGYQLSGPQTRSCQANGKWSGTQPECVGEYNTHQHYVDHHLVGVLSVLVGVLSVLVGILPVLVCVLSVLVCVLSVLVDRCGVCTNQVTNYVCNLSEMQFMDIAVLVHKCCKHRSFVCLFIQL